MTTKQPLPWERRDDETDPAWNAFRRYRDYPTDERSMPRLASDMVNERPGQTPEKPRKPEHVQRELERWSSIHQWRERVTAWDREIDRRSREQAADEILNARRRHARYMQTLLEAGIKPAIELVERIRDQKLVLAEVSSADLYKLTIAFSRVAPALVAAERAARGEVSDQPTEAVPQVVSDLQVTDEQLMELWAVLEDLGITPIPPVVEIESTATEEPDE